MSTCQCALSRSITRRWSTSFARVSWWNTIQEVQAYHVPSPDSRRDPHAMTVSKPNVSQSMFRLFTNLMYFYLICPCRLLLYSRPFVPHSHSVDLCLLQLFPYFACSNRIILLTLDSWQESNRGDLHSVASVDPNLDQHNEVRVTLASSSLSLRFLSPPPPPLPGY